MTCVRCSITCLFACFLSFFPAYLPASLALPTWYGPETTVRSSADGDKDRNLDGGMSHQGKPLSPKSRNSQCTFIMHASLPCCPHLPAPAPQIAPPPASQPASPNSGGGAVALASCSSKRSKSSSCLIEQVQYMTIDTYDIKLPLHTWGTQFAKPGQRVRSDSCDDAAQ